MPSLKMETPHTLGKQEAARRLKEKFSVVRGAFQSHVSDVVEAWDGDEFRFGFKALGMQVAGTVVVGECDVKVNADLPLAALMFKGAIEKQIRDELGELLAADGQPG